MPTDDRPVRIIRFSELRIRVQLSRSTVWRQIKAHQFPSAVRLSRNARGWYEHEIDEWLLQRQRI
jgi:prophage regulatory protein